MIREEIKSKLNDIYRVMTLDELNSIGVFVVTVNNEDDEYCHSGFNILDNIKQQEKESFTKLDKMAMDILRHSLSELNKSRDKHNSYNWTPEEMSQYAYKMADSMLQESKSYE
ncbi:MAG: hypothetical protein WBA74_10355 [Cyclobacteriaceae bacterium]